MPSDYLDFRSDTVTRPTPGMRACMAEAEVGDDVFGEDPTVNRLQRRAAEMLGKEAALFVPSGTMANLIGVRLHCRPGDEMICEAGCHVYNFEQGGYAQLNGVVARPLQGQQGILRPQQLAELTPSGNVHHPRTRLVWLENTHNLGGGRIQPYDVVEAICRWAAAQGLRTHLDGARLFNAVVATGIEAARWTQHFDTVSVCFSKGLGARSARRWPGRASLIAEAVRHRKVLGGGMRQAGVLAAAALYALENHVARLEEDHANARRLADGIARTEGLRLDPESIDTNMLFFRVAPETATAGEFVARLRERGVLMLTTGSGVIRAVTHLDVTAADVDRAIAAIQDAARRS